MLNYSEFYNIEHEVIRSLRENSSDYCYDYSKLDIVIKSIENYLKTHSKKFSVAYMIKKDKYGEFDYIKFIPVKYFCKKGNKEKEICGLIYDFEKIPDNIKCGIRKPNYETIKIIKNYKE